MERLTAEVERFTQGSLFESLEEANAALRERFSGPIDDLPSTATTLLEKAQDLMYRAFEARGRRRIQLARKALELSADCADAYVLLAEESHASRGRPRALRAGRGRRRAGAGPRRVHAGGRPLLGHHRHPSVHARAARPRPAAWKISTGATRRSSTTAS